MGVNVVEDGLEKEGVKDEEEEEVWDELCNTAVGVEPLPSEDVCGIEAISTTGAGLDRIGVDTFEISFGDGVLLL